MSQERLKVTDLVADQQEDGSTTQRTGAAVHCLSDCDAEARSQLALEGNNGEKSLGGFKDMSSNERMNARMHNALGYTRSN